MLGSCECVSKLSICWFELSLVEIIFVDSDDDERDLERMKSSRLSSIYVTPPSPVSPIEIELGMPSRCVFIATTRQSASADPNQGPSTATSCTRVDLAPSHPFDQCHTEAAVRPSWAGRTQFPLGTARLSKQPEKAQPIRLPRPACPSWGPPSCFALLCLLAGWTRWGSGRDQHIHVGSP